jgi:hypothetical protein
MGNGANAVCIIAFILSLIAVGFRILKSNIFIDKNKSIK